MNFIHLINLCQLIRRLFFIVLFSNFCLVDANAFSEGDEGHTSITENAVKFLYSKVTRSIVKNNISEDHGNTSGFPYRHGQNCQFKNSAIYINGRYKGAINAIKYPSTNNAKAIQYWGLLLHGVQDFYSHSSWVDPAPIGLNMGQALFNGNLGWWPVYTPYSRWSNDLIIVEGNPPSGFAITLPVDQFNKPTSTVPMVTRLLDGAKFRGIMTSAAAPIDDVSQLCPPVGSDCFESSAGDVCIRHGDCDDELIENCFHHDGTDGSNAINKRRKLARQAAQRQTEYEWCRFLHLTKSEDPTYWASSQLMALWVEEDKHNSSTPHIDGTPCQRGGAKRNQVIVELVNLNDKDADFSTFTLFRGDFTSSSRSIVESGSGNKQKLSICTNEGETVVASVWSWKKDILPAPYTESGFGPTNPVVGGAVLPVVIAKSPKSVTYTDHRALKTNINASFKITINPGGCT